MGCSPSTLGSGVDVLWTVPKEIQDRTDIDTVNVFKSGCLNVGYEKIGETNYKCQDGTYNTHYHDIGGNRQSFYLVTFAASAANFESCWHLTYFQPTPQEMWYINQIRSATPDVIRDTMTNEDFLNGLNLALGIFNAYPPTTYFTLCQFPKTYAFFLVGLSQLTALTSRYLPISIRDWRYSEPGGVVMDIDRGTKINQAMDIIAKTYTQYLPLVKLDFSDDLPMGLGTIQLPLSMGGIVSRGILNILDVFTATGR